MEMGKYNFFNKVIIIFDRNLAEVVGGCEAVVEGVIQEVKRFHLIPFECWPLSNKRNLQILNPVFKAFLVLSRR